MKGMNLHNDPLFDALKNAFDDYQPDFNADDLNADWSNVKSQINAPQAGNVNKPDVSGGFKTLLNLKNVIITSVSGVAIIATTVVMLNQQRNNENQTSPIKNTTVQPSSDDQKNIAITQSPDHNQTNTISFNDAVKETQKDHPTNSAGYSSGGNTNYPPLIPQIISNTDPKSPKITEQPKTDIVDNQNIPWIIISDRGFPKQDEIYVSDTQFCQNQIIKISYNFKDPGNQKLFVSMQGKALSDVNNGFSYQFSKAGWYNLTLVIQNYASTFTKFYRINVVINPIASFNFSMTESPAIKFINQSKYADNFRWQFDDNSTSSSENPAHRYLDTGLYKVLLIAATDGVCADTTLKYIHVQSFVEPEIPNTFSPNNDGINDEFYIKINNETIYELTIFDRNSNLIFSSKDKNEKWNGNFRDSTKQCPAGTYFYFLNYKIEGQDQSSVKTGTITLFR
jgi:gliding motility-associated-like protein